jgi:ribosome maturation factor RimP
MDLSFEKSVKEALERAFEYEELQDCYLVEIKHSGNKLVLFVDSDSGMTLKKCTLISRKVELMLDESELLGLKYTLEVSSPGLDQPIKLLRQYKRNIGKELKIWMKDNLYLEGTLVEVKQETIQIELTPKKLKKGKKKKEDVSPILEEIRIEEIEKALVSIKF